MSIKYDPDRPANLSPGWRLWPKRVLFIHPNYHSGGAEIAGNWPPDWVAYLTGALKQAGFMDVQFIDAMTYDIGDDELKRRIFEANADIIGTTAITPSIYKAERALEMARETCPDEILSGKPDSPAGPGGAWPAADAVWAKAAAGSHRRARLDLRGDRNHQLPVRAGN